MQSARTPGHAQHPTLAASIAALAALLLAGCGMPGAPQPPTLNIPNRVADLSAVRSGNQVSLAWTMPVRNTDKLLLKDNVAVRVCRNQTNAAGCNIVATLQLAPGSDAAYTDALPPDLAAGMPRAITYYVELKNRKGRSAGLSNGVDIPAGEVPAAVAGLSAEVRKDGILLRWSPAPPDAQSAAVRLNRKLVTPPAEKSRTGPLATPAEPPERTLMVETGGSTSRALDSDIRFGETYEYRAQRVVRIPVNGELLELASPISDPIRADAINGFPPGVPRSLAAVATTGENGNPPSVDLSWLPDTDIDLAGYIVYRREGDGNWQRISTAQAAVGPSFHDANVQPGHTYVYAVSAIGQNGHESARSAEAQETVSAP
jgi:hypothetical protein